MSDDMCRATTNTGFAVATCYLLDGHDGQHDDGSYHWPNVQPLQERGPEPCGNVSPNRVSRRALDAGHDGQHGSSNSSWPQARSNYRSDQLTGAKIDDLLLDLFRRVEQLEQLARPTASCASEELRQGLGEVEKRMTRLEQAQVYSTSPHDLSALQASINTQFERLNGAICMVNSDAQQRNQAMVDRLSAMWDVLAAMAPVIDALGSAEHPEECHGEVCFKSVPDGAQTERASGSPAAVQCSTRFREGQCSGWLGHHGDCAVVPDPEQLEDLEEFQPRCSELVLGVRCTLGAGHPEDCSTAKH